MFPQESALDAEAIGQRLREYILANLLLEDTGVDLDWDASLIEEGILDSFGLLELVNHIQACYGVAIGGEELTPENFNSIRRLAAFLERKQAALTAKQLVS